MIILLQINYSQDHSEKVLPLGILSVGSALKKNGFQVELINITEKEIDKNAEKIIERNPEYVGFSVMTGIQTKHSAQLSKKIKELNPQIPILWGGIHPSLLPDQCLNEKYIDYVIIGEGEETILEFSEALKETNNFRGILGLGYKDFNSKPIINQGRPLIKNLDKWRLDFSLLNMEKYVYRLGANQRVVAYKTSRGCPFHCGFCYNYEFNQGRWRAWSIDTVVEDIKFLKKNFKIDGIKFYDDNFFVDKNRALNILKKINLPSHIEIRIDFIDDKLVKALKELKVFDLLIGLESGSDRLLQLISKGFSVERSIAGVRSIAKLDLHATYSFIVGLPTETKKEFESTVGLMYKIYKIHPMAGFTLGVYLPYPGSQLYSFSLEHGFNYPTQTEDWGKIDRFRKDFDSPWVDVKKVWLIRECYKILSWDLKIFKKWFEFRIKHRFYSFPIDIYMIEFLSGMAIEERGILGRLLRQIYNFIRIKK
jgi:anaerobic magnesium-protoporphyrin IX monomethyl ester cyclase